VSWGWRVWAATGLHIPFEAASHGAASRSRRHTPHVRRNPHWPLGSSEHSTPHPSALQHTPQAPLSHSLMAFTAEELALAQVCGGVVWWLNALPRVPGCKKAVGRTASCCATCAGSVGDTPQPRRAALTRRRRHGSFHSPLTCCMHSPMRQRLLWRPGTWTTWTQTSASNTGAVGVSKARERASLSSTLVLPPPHTRTPAHPTTGWSPTSLAPWRRCASWACWRGSWTPTTPRPTHAWRPSAKCAATPTRCVCRGFGWLVWCV
jgi:hypothetical protein